MRRSADTRKSGVRTTVPHVLLLAATLMTKSLLARQRESQHYSHREAERSLQPRGVTCAKKEAFGDSAATANWSKISGTSASSMTLNCRGLSKQYLHARAVANLRGGRPHSGGG